MPQAGTETFGVQVFEHRSGCFSTSESVRRRQGFRGECAELGNNATQAARRKRCVVRLKSKPATKPWKIVSRRAIRPRTETDDGISASLWLRQLLRQGVRDLPAKDACHR